MIPIGISEILKAVDGTLLWGGRRWCCYKCGDRSTKSQEKCSLFVPIVGERVDAHQFIPQVMQAGASVTFSSRKDVVPAISGSCIYVEDTLAALQKAAAYYRSRFDIPVIGVTGSVGKRRPKR